MRHHLSNDAGDEQHRNLHVRTSNVRVYCKEPVGRSPLGVLEAPQVYTHADALTNAPNRSADLGNAVNSVQKTHGCSLLN